MIQQVSLGNQLQKNALIFHVYLDFLLADKRLL